MASNAFDNMDDFFDFAAMDRDAEGDSIGCPSHHQPSQSDLTDAIIPMDCAMDPIAAYTTLCGALPQDVHMCEDIHDYQPNQQWPLIDDVDHISAFTEEDGVGFTAPTPLQSSGLGDNDDEGLTDPFGLELDSSMSQGGQSPSQNHTPLVPPQVKLSTRPRQSSVTSWKPASAKRKGPQSRIPIEAKQILEDEFAANPYPCSWEMDIIAHQANLDVKKVRNWFNNTRARKKGGEALEQDPLNNDVHSLKTKLSKDSLEALTKHANDTIQSPQPPLAVYLAQSYQEEAVEISAVQAALDDSLLSVNGQDDAWSDSRTGRRGSVITSVASSEGTAPTTYTVSSSGSRSNISSFGRERRRGRRRMAWKESPRQNINGVNSAGEPQKDLPFFCTFCPRAFKTKYEWIRHEDSVHALRTTWICCDTKPAAILQACPFCGQARPDDAHMAGHKYQQCRSKPESQRTFYRRDHFIQHLHHLHFTNAKHPSVRVGCQARLLAAEGHHFGCKDLAMKWRRFGAPMKLEDPMLHCGFCGKRSKDWSERCEHVAEHLIAREFDRAVWWGERKENHLGNLYSASPYESFRCRYCQKVFTNITEMNEHSHCRVWSCRYLKSFDDVAADNAGPPLYPDFPTSKAHHCHLCGSGYRTLHIEHAQNHHRFRSCNQEFYTSEEAFLQHLHNFHSASHPTLLRGSSVIEQSFMRNKGASFEPVEFNETWQPCVMDLDVEAVSPFVVDSTTPTLPTGQKKMQTHERKQPSARKKPREVPQSPGSSAQKVQRQRSETTTSKPDSQSPRFFSLTTHFPLRSFRVFYSRGSKASDIPKDDQNVLEEMPKPHVASLAMSAGLVGMASVQWAIKPEKHVLRGMVELTLDDEDKSG